MNKFKESPGKFLYLLSHACIVGAVIGIVSSLIDHRSMLIGFFLGVFVPILAFLYIVIIMSFIDDD